MLTKTGAELMPGGADSEWGPTVDGDLLADQPAAVLAKTGLNPGVSVLWGGNTNDSAVIFMLKEYGNFDNFWTLIPTLSDPFSLIVASLFANCRQPPLACMPWLPLIGQCN